MRAVGAVAILIATYLAWAAYAGGPDKPIVIGALLFLLVGSILIGAGTKEEK